MIIQIISVMLAYTLNKAVVYAQMKLKATTDHVIESVVDKTIDETTKIAKKTASYIHNKNDVSESKMIDTETQTDNAYDKIEDFTI